MPESKDDTPQVPKKRRRTIAIAAGIVAALLAGGGGAAWYLVGPEDDEGDAPRRRHNPVFASLEPFTVNLADSDGDRVAQVGVVLELVDSKASATVTLLMPAVRNGILLLLSGKKSEDLLTVQGKSQLAGEIAVVTGGHLGWTPPADAPARDEDDAPAPKAAKGERSAKSARKSRAVDSPNPVTAVHFSQFLVQ